MQTIQTYYNPLCINVSNQVNVSSTEIIILNTNILGYQNFSTNITNSSGNTLTSINIYGSSDNENFYIIALNALSSVGAGTTQQYSFNFINKFIRITAISAGVSTILCNLIGAP